MLAVCPTCHRKERWTNGVREVLIEGGARQPASSLEREGFDRVFAASQGEVGPIVGACPCGLPLVGEAGAPVGDYLLALPPGELRVSPGGVTLAGEPVDLDALAAKVHVAFPLAVSDGATPTERLFAGSLLTMMLFPVVVWVFAVSVVVVFYSHWASGGGSVGMP